MDEIQGSVEIVRLGLEAVKLGAGFSRAAWQKLLAIRHARILSKSGQVSYETLIRHMGPETQILNIATENRQDLIQIEKVMTDAKVMFCRLPDLKVGDGYTQFMIHASDAQKMSVIMKALNGKFETAEMTADEYTATGTKEQWDEIRQKAVKNILEDSPGKAHEEQKAETTNAYSKINSLRNDQNYIELSIDKETLVDRSADQIRILNLSDDQFACRIPGTYGNTERFLILPDTHVFAISGEEKERFAAFLSKDEQPVIMALDQENGKDGASVINYVMDETFAEDGAELAEKHFDQVEPRQQFREERDQKQTYMALSDIRKEKLSGVQDAKDAADADIKKTKQRDEVRRKDVINQAKSQGAREVILSADAMLLETSKEMVFQMPGEENMGIRIPQDLLIREQVGYRAVIDPQRMFRAVDFAKAKSAAEEAEKTTGASVMSAVKTQQSIRGSEIIRRMRELSERVIIKQEEQKNVQKEVVKKWQDKTIM